jgi:hypothetical protein
MEHMSKTKVEAGTKIKYIPRGMKDSYTFLEEDMEYMEREFPDFATYCPYDEIKHKKTIAYARLKPRYMAWIRYINAKYGVPQDYIIERLIDQVRASGSFNLSGN